MTVRCTKLVTEATVSLAGNRLRTFLAMLGIVIGISSMVMLTSVGVGSQRAIEEAIAKLGTNLLMVRSAGSRYRRVSDSESSRLDLKDGILISQVPEVEAVAPTTNAESFRVFAGKLSWSTKVVGTTSDFFMVRDWSLASGEFFNSEDLKYGNRVMVIGSTIANNLFPDQDAVGEVLRVNNLRFTIIGVLDSKGQGYDGRDEDDIIYIPFTTAQSKLFDKTTDASSVQTIYVKIYTKEAIPYAIERITETLRARYHMKPAEDNYFNIRDIASISQAASEASRALAILLGAIASISLLVGGIGIMNIMLVTVSERTREIGIRKAIGANEQDILQQFLLEAIIICAIGSGIGLILGFSGSLLVEYLFAIPAAITIWAVLLAMGTALVIGILSGLYPAQKAAQLQPIEALRVVGT